MGNMRTQHIILLVKMKTINDEGGPKPWCWMKFAETMRFSEGTYPIDGITKLPMTALDFRGIADKKETYETLHVYFRAFKDTMENDKVLKALARDSKTNDYRDGVAIFRAYWARVVVHAKMIAMIDSLLLEHEAMPWQAAKAYGMDWTERTKVRRRSTICNSQTDLY